MRLKRIFTHRLIRALRLALPAVVLVLIAIPTWNYWSRRSASSLQPAIRPLPADLAVRTDGFRFSRTEGGRTVFSVFAKTSLGFTDNKQLLEDVEVIVYGEDPGQPVRRIRSRQCKYDGQTGDIVFIENVEMQLDDRTRGRTDELIYNHQKRIITSTSGVVFEQPDTGTTGESKELEYDISTGALRLAGGVKIRNAEGAVLEGGSAVLHQKESWAAASGGILLRTSGAWVRGSTGRAELRPDTLMPRVVVVEGGASAESYSRSQSESWSVRAARLETSVSAAGIAEHVRARGDVEFRKISDGPVQILSGGEIDAIMDASGQVQRLDARREAHMIMGSDRTLRSEMIRIDASGSISTEGASTLQLGDSFIEGRNFTIQQGDIVTFSTSNRANLRSGERRTSADRTVASFDSQSNSLIDLVQTGDFEFEEGERSGRSAQARFEDGGGVVILEGLSSFSLPEMRLQAGVIQFREDDSSFIADTNVVTVTNDSEEPVLVTAGRAEGASGRITYLQNVQMWSGRAEIKSDRLVVSDADKTLHAEGNVRSKLDSVQATSDRLDYDNRENLAHFTGNVRAQRQDMFLEAREMTVSAPGKTVSEIVARGNVLLTQGGQRGTGGEAVYDVRTESIVLTGRNAEFSDPERGAVQGSRLVMSRTGDRLMVESEAGSRVESRYRVQQ